MDSGGGPGTATTLVVAGAIRAALTLFPSLTLTLTLTLTLAHPLSLTCQLAAVRPSAVSSLGSAPAAPGTRKYVSNKVGNQKVSGRKEKRSRIGTYFVPASGTGHGAAVGQARRYWATPESLHALMHLGLG